MAASHGEHLFRCRPGTSPSAQYECSTSTLNTRRRRRGSSWRSCPCSLRVPVKRALVASCSHEDVQDRHATGWSQHSLAQGLVPATAVRRNPRAAAASVRSREERHPIRVASSACQLGQYPPRKGRVHRNRVPELAGLGRLEARQRHTVRRLVPCHCGPVQAATRQPLQPRGR